MGPVPVPEERRFRLEPGELSDRDRGVAIEAASIESSEMEKRYLQSIIPKLSEAAFVGEGKCRQVTELDEQWSLMLQGYDVVLSAVRDGCAVGIEPSRKQHGRTFRGVITP